MRASIIVAVGLGMLFASPALVAQSGEEQESMLVPLEKILAHPQAFKDIEVSTVVQFHSVGSLDNPVYTRYERDWYLNFSAWPDGSRLWERSAYMDDFPYFFVKRRTDPAKAMLKAPAFSRWIVTGKVTRVWKNQPWFDVCGLRSLDTQLDDVALRYIVDGYALQNSGQWAQAAAAFRAAEHPSLPSPIRVMVMREEAICLNAVGQTPLAVQRLENALAVIPNDPASTSLLVEYRHEMGLDAEGNPLPLPEPQVSSGGMAPQATPVAPAPAAQPYGHAPMQPAYQPPAQPYGHEQVQPTPQPPAQPYDHHVAQPAPPAPPPPAPPYHHEQVQPVQPAVAVPSQPEVVEVPAQPTAPQPTATPPAPTTRPAVPKVSLEVVPPEKKDPEEQGSGQ